jgi:general secretion pathway protein E/type IV pilus assembly protein PilB
MAIRFHMMPVGEAQGRLQIACADPFDWQSWDNFCHMIRLPMGRVLCPPKIIERMIKANYGIGADTVDRLMTGRSQEQGDPSANVDLSEAKAANEPSVVNLVNQILLEAIRANATDIHFEPYDTKYRIRYRIDGMLEDVPIPASVNVLKLAVVSRIKIMAGLDITEKRLPQDGRALVAMGEQKSDLRISILPGIHGEAVVIRIQNRQSVKLDLQSLGFELQERQAIGQLVTKPYGMFLVTGPTGSGKTTTLYTCLKGICSSWNKIITIEDPVEYWMDNMLQMQVKEKIGFTFARALRSVLRHDPDVVLVGEIRDRETAEIAVRSALTGHLVFATLHTNDAAGAATRLCDIGIEPFLVASSVYGILAQRLVRKICTDCKMPLPAESLDELGQRLLQDSGCWGTVQLWKGKGCEKCRFTGYRGRMAVGELLKVSPAIRRLIQNQEPSDRIKQLACQEGMRTLRDAAIVALKAGKTTVAEILRVSQEED